MLHVKKKIKEEGNKRKFKGVCGLKKKINDFSYLEFVRYRAQTLKNGNRLNY